MYSRLLIIALVLLTGCASQDAGEESSSINPYKIGIIGDSVACGQFADSNSGETFNPATMLNDASMLISFGPSVPVNGWANQLYAALLEKNPNYQVINLCGSGWDTGDQLGTASAKSGKTKVFNNAQVFASMQDKPARVLVALGINDWGHGQGLAFYHANMERIIDILESAGITPIIVIENPVKNGSQYQAMQDTSADVLGTAGNYKFAQEAQTIAKQRGLDTIDFFSELNSNALAEAGADFEEKILNTGLYHDSTHPNQRGHDVMARAAISYFLNR